MICKFCNRNNDDNIEPSTDSSSDMERKILKSFHLDPYITLPNLPQTPVQNAFIQAGFLCWNDGNESFKCKIQCKQYEPSIVNTPLCKLEDAPKFDWVDVDKYTKSPGYGNCDHINHLAISNPMFANKVFMENNIKFTAENTKYTEIYYDIETFNTGNYAVIPLANDPQAKIGIISMYIPSRNSIKLFCLATYAYDIDLIKEFIGDEFLMVEVRTFEHEIIMCHNFISALDDVAGTKLLMGFRSSVGSNSSDHKSIGYDLPFILERTHYHYTLNVKMGVSMYHNYNNRQIMTVDILPQTYVLDVSVLLYQNLTQNEHTKMVSYSLDDHLSMNGLDSKLDHNYELLQKILHVGFDDHIAISQIMAYCAYDSIALHKLNNKRQLITSRLAYIDILNVPFNFVLYQTVATQLKCHLMQLFGDAGYLCQYLKSSDHEALDSVKYKGAHTQKISDDDVWKVLHNLTILDFASQYPSAIINYNISLETQCSPKDSDGFYHTIDTSDDPSIDHDVIRYIRSEKLGVIPTLAQRFLTERSKAKQLMKSDEDNVQQHNNRQLALKVASNTIYGLLGNSRHTLFDKSLAASVTAAGRHSIKTVRDYLASKSVDTKFIDTDSVAVALIGTVVHTEKEYNDFIIDINAYIKQNLGPWMVLNDEDILYKVMFPPKSKSYAKLAIDRDDFFAGNFDSLDLVVKGPSWSLMTPYIKQQTESIFKEILTTERNYRDIVSDFKTYHTSRVETAIRNGDFSTINQYSKRIRVSGSKSPIALAISRRLGSTDKYCYVFFKRQKFKSDKKDSLVLPALALDSDNVAEICINSCLNNIMDPFKRFFNMGLTKEEEFWNNRDIIPDSDLITVREESIINGVINYKFNQYHQDDLESMIRSNKAVSFHEMVPDEPHKLFFDVESTTESIDIASFVNYLVSVLGPLTAHIANASKPGKISYHVVCDIVVYNTHNKYIAIEYNKNHKNICDIAVYSNHSSLRMVGTNKIMKNLIKFETPARPFIIQTNHPSTFEDFIIKNIWDAEVVPWPWKYDESPMLDIPAPKDNDSNSNAAMYKLEEFMIEYNIKAEISKSGRFFAIIPTEKHVCPICDRFHDSNPLFAYVAGWSKLVVRCRRNRSDPIPKPDIEYILDVESPPKKSLAELIGDIHDSLKSKNIT